MRPIQCTACYGTVCPPACTPTESQSSMSDSYIYQEKQENKRRTNRQYAFPVAPHFMNLVFKEFRMTTCRYRSQCVDIGVNVSSCVNVYGMPQGQCVRFRVNTCALELMCVSDSCCACSDSAQTQLMCQCHRVNVRSSELLSGLNVNVFLRLTAVNACASGQKQSHRIPCISNRVRTCVPVA